MDNEMSFKDLYSCYIKTTYPIEVGNKTFQANEPLMVFDSIQIAGFDFPKAVKTANGGWDNRPRVFWETAKEEKIYFRQGIFSIPQLSILSNSKLLSDEEPQTIQITKTELKESDENGVFTILETPIELFIYNKETSEKITNYSITNNTITIETPFLDLIVTYTYNYTNDAKIVKIGKQFMPGYLSLEARTRVKDDKSGLTKTGIIKIPKIKLMSDLSMRLGQQANPMALDFSAIGIPVGGRGNTYISDFIFLDEDLESDI